MQGTEAVVGKFYLPPRVKQPLEVLELLRGKDGEGPLTEIRVKNIVSGNELNLPADYEVGEEIDELEVDSYVAAAKSAGAAATIKAKKEKKEKTSPPVAAAPAEPASAIPAEAPQEAVPAPTSNEDTMSTKKKAAKPKKAKNAGELRGRPKNGAPTRSGVIDKLLAAGNKTCAQIVDVVMNTADLKVPKADAKKIRTLVSVRISRAQAAGGKYERNAETKVVKVVFAEKKVKEAKPKKEKKAKA